MSTPCFRQTNNLLIRLIAGIYGLAFASLAVQITGLCGPRGIFPVSDWLSYLANQAPGITGFWTYPTIFWFGSSDAWLLGACFAGAACAVAAAAGAFPAIFIGACWLIYLSFYTAAGPFLHFQWDLLLLEAGFLAIFAAPFCGYRTASEPSRAIPFLFRLLLFKLLFTSGLCKLASGDLTWRTLTALHFHYQTQPLPPWTAWYFHHLPDFFHRLSVIVLFAAELVLPFFILAGRRGRMATFWGTVFLQILIVLSGNYGFFNWITIVLALSLWDDRRSGGATVLSGSSDKTRRTIAAGLCVLIVPVSVYISATRWIHGVPRLSFVDRWIVTPLQTWPIIGTYGLFSVMTTQRREIVIEGSNDGEIWQAYEFRWKPGDLKRCPAFTTPHMPRVDWQMWFAALGTWRQNPWFMQLCQRILEGSPAVLKLLSYDPFAGQPPQYLRALLYEYRFSGATDRRLGLWWERKLLGLYAPAMALQSTRARDRMIE